MMAGLVGYASSDEDEGVESSQWFAAKSEPEASKEAHEEEESRKESKPSQGPQAQDEKPVVGPVQQNAAPVGPSLPPAEDSYVPAVDPGQAPGSPYSANRAMIHDLTLPSVPNLDIPPSPPGSPPPGANKKLEQFLELKKKGVHFNSKLDNSTALRNPSLMDKLMGFVEIDERSQYETTLPSDLWNPKGFPDYAYRDQLKKSHDKIAKERESEKASGGRTTVDFVQSTTTPAAGCASSGAGVLRGEKRKGGWN